MLREYQELAKKEIYALYRKGVRSVLLYAPTGSGKTHLSSSIVADSVSKNRRVLFLVHRTKLIDQTVATLIKNYGISLEQISVIAPDRISDYARPIQIAMVETITNREYPPDIGLIIIDEAHTVTYHDAVTKILNHYSEKVYCKERGYVDGPWVLSKYLVLGLSASPWRTNTHEGFCHFFQAVVRTPYPEELIDQGHLCPARYFSWKDLLDESKLKVGKEGDYTQKSLRITCDSSYNSAVVNRFIQQDPGRKAIAFCAYVEQAEDLARQFNEVGIVSAVMHGELPESTRQYIYTAFKTGEIRIITSVGVLCEGFDEPSCDAAIIARPTKSRALFVQMCGRALRTFPGKSDSLILDFGMNIKRLDFPTNKFATPLCPPYKRQKGKASSKTCPACNAELATAVKICPECGYIFEYDDDDDEDDFIDVYIFEEMHVSTEQKRQIEHFRNLLRSHYTNAVDIGEADAAFFAAYNILPREHWALNAIFMRCGRIRKIDRLEDEQNLLRYFKETRPNATSDWLRGQMQREFGKGNYRLTIWDWKEVFSISNGDVGTYESVIRAYSDMDNNTTDPEVKLVLKFCLKKAIDENPQWNTNPKIVTVN